MSSLPAGPCAWQAVAHWGLSIIASSAFVFVALAFVSDCMGWHLIPVGVGERWVPIIQLIIIVKVSMLCSVVVDDNYVSLISYV